MVNCYSASNAGPIQVGGLAEAQLSAELEKLRKKLSDKEAEDKALSDELEKLRKESSNKAAERKVLELKFTDFEKDMKSLEDTISSKQWPTGEEEMKEKLAELKVHM